MHVFPSSLLHPRKEKKSKKVRLYGMQLIETFQTSRIQWGCVHLQKQLDAIHAIQIEVIKNWKILCNEKVRLFLQSLSNCAERARKNQTFRGFKFSLFLSGLKQLKKARARYTLHFIRNFYMNLQPEICQNFKNMLRTYPRLREKQFIFFLLLLS